MPEIENRLKIKAKRQLGIITTPDGEPVALGEKIQILDAELTTRVKKGGSYSMPGEDNWNSNWEPTGPKPPWPEHPERN